MNIISRILPKVLAIGFGAAVLTAAASAQAATNVSIGVDFNVLGAQVWVAQDKGFFKKHDVNVDVRAFALGIDTIDATLTGQLDFGIGIDFATLTRMASGHLKIVSGALDPEAGFHKLAVNSSIKKPEDLAGKKIGIAQGTAQHLVTINYLKNYGIDPSKAQLIPLPSLLEIIAALRSGQIDAAFVWGDGVAQAEKIPGVTILSDDKPAHVRLHGYLATTNAYAANNKQAVEDTLRALIDATDFIDNHFDEAVDIVAKHAKAPRESIAAQMKNQHYTISLTPEQLAGFELIADFAAANHITKTKIDPRKYIDPSFLKAVDPSRVTLKD